MSVWLLALSLLAADPDPEQAELRKAIQEESARVEVAPDDAEALQRLGLAFLALGEPEKAVGPFRELVRRRDGPTARLLLSRALRLSGEGTEARAVLVAAIAAFPGDASLHAERGLMARRFDETDIAIVEYGR